MARPLRTSVYIVVTPITTQRAQWTQILDGSLHPQVTTNVNGPYIDLSEVTLHHLHK